MGEISMGYYYYHYYYNYNPPRIPREHNEHHGYTVRSTPNCPLMVQFLCLVYNKNNLQGCDFQHPLLNLLAKKVLLGVSKFTTKKKKPAKNPGNGIISG